MSFLLDLFAHSVAATYKKIEVNYIEREKKRGKKGKVLRMGKNCGRKRKRKMRMMEKKGKGKQGKRERGRKKGEREKGRGGKKAKGRKKEGPWED